MTSRRGLYKHALHC